MTAYYNEIDPHAAQWLRNLIDAGHIAAGVVDERSIEDVLPDELRGFTQCHFFAGIGVWSLALRRAGWPDDRPVWTGSCPCQPFSSAGKGAGFSDERHLWPAFHWLIQECRPPVVYGEQVASSDVGPWLDLVQADLEALDYALGACAFPSAGVGAPHLRDRLFWLAHASSARLERRHAGVVGDELASAQRSGAASRLADADHERRDGQHALLQRQERGRKQSDRLEAPGGREAGRVADAESGGRPEERADAGGRAVRDSAQGIAARPEHGCGPVNGYWAASDWVLCRDPDGPTWRPVEPGTFPLAHGVANRVGRLRAYGNAINASAAEIFIRSTMT